MADLRAAGSALVLLVGGLVACADDGSVNPVPDAGVGDADVPDSGADADAGAPDQGPDDSGSADGGSGQNPGLIFRGVEQIGSQRLFIEGRGTTTSTSNPVVFLSFLPGFGADYWRRPSEFLFGPGGEADANRALIYIDLLAQGRSSVSDDEAALITPENQARSLGNALDHIRTTYFDDETRFDVVAHGYGALIVALHEAERSGDFERAVLIAPYPSNVDDWSQWNSNYKTDPRFDARALVELEISARCRRDTEQCEIDQFKIYGVSWVCPENQSAFFEVDVKTASRVGQDLIERDLRNTSYDYDRAISSIRAKTTLITGACDQIPEESFVEYESRIPGLERFHLLDAGFFPMLETPEKFRRLLKEALDVDGVTP